MPIRLSIETRDRIKRLSWSGLSNDQVAAIVGCAPTMVSKMRKVCPWPPRNRSELRLSREEREEICRGLALGKSLREIARDLKRSASTITREVKIQGADRYRAWRGDERAEKLMGRPKARKLDASPKLAKAVEGMLQLNWSPKQIERRLRLDYPDDPTMRVSHETIYKTLYIQGRGALRKELTHHLRQGHEKRKPRARKELRGKIRDKVHISQRPPEVADRAVPGHWEGDLIVGKEHGSVIGTLVERSTRYVMLLHLPHGKSAEHVRIALTKKIRQLPEELRRSLTWDQGHELAEHAQFTVDTGVKVFFCDPHSPWQRGSNENTNGLLRQYFPKGTDLSVHSERELDRVARQLNGRPRETLGWRTPAEKIDELLRQKAA